MEYKIDPIGEKWYPVEAGGKIIINRLPYGKYTLLVRKINGWGEGNLSRIGMSFEVLPHWYNTGWSRLLMITALVCLALLAFRLRIRILRGQNVRLQNSVRERTLELEQSTLLKEKLLSVIMHDLRSPLFSMSMLIGYLGENYKRLPSSEVDELLGQLEDSSKSLCQFSTDFLTWYNSQKEGFAIRKESIGLAGFARDTGAFYKDLADKKGIAIHYDIPQELELISDKNILAVVIRNVMDNAVKYTKSGSISVRAEKKNTVVHIQVQDTGVGMTHEKIRELLSYGENNDHQVSSSFGYRFITELSRKLDGNIGIDSEPGKGTVVTVMLRS